MARALLVTLVLVLSSLTLQHELHKDEICVYGCQESFYGVVFATTKETEDYYTGYCSDTLKLSSTYFCSKMRCSPDEIHHGVAFIEKECEEMAKIKLPSFESVVGNYTEDNVASVRVIQNHEVLPTDIINSIILPSDDLFDLSYRTWDVWIHEVAAHKTYGWASLGFWGLVLLIGTVNRGFALIFSHHGGSFIPDAESGPKRRPSVSRPLGGLRDLFRAHVTLPATFGYHHQQPGGWCTIPTRLESALIFVFLALNIILCWVDYIVFSGHIYWPRYSSQIWRYLADRTGIIAFANLPLVWLFASRNDFFLWLTGWSFAGFNAFHKWIARIVTIQAVLHSIDSGLAEYKAAFKEQYWYTGVIATVTMCLLIGVSVYPLRKKSYELFWILHIGFALITLVSLFFHVKIFEGLYEPYLWPCVAFWSFDYLIRIGRLILLNYKMATRSSTKAVAEYDEATNIIRLTVTSSIRHQPKSGAHYFLYFPTLWKTSGCHPFTMSGWSFGDQSNGSMSSASPSLSAADHSEKTAVPVTQDLRSGSQDSTSAGSSTSLGGPLRLNFLIRPYKGMTAHLRGFILQGGTGRREINAFIEGPYGESAPVFEADSVLFIAGGSGISAVLPFLHQLRHPQPALPRFGKTRRSTTTMTKDMHVVWAVREQAFASGVVASELHVPSKRGNPTITLSIHVTGRTSSSPPLPASPSVGDDKPGRPSLSPTTTTLSEPGQDSQRPHPPTFTFHRPDINAIVHGAARDASARGSLAVFVCGPAQMADQARRAAVEVVRMRAGAGGAGAVKYYEEKFGW